MNGFTGFDPELAEKNILDFTSYWSFHGNEFLLQAFSKLFSDLRDTWSSPNAVEFSNKYVPICENICLNFNKTIESIANNAIRAYESLSSVNGYYGRINRENIGQYYDTDTQSWHDGHVRSSINFDTLLPEKDGIVGMNKLQVGIILQEFNANINEFFNVLDGIPMNIAFYDTDGSQQEAYRNAIEQAKVIIIQEAKNVVDAINGYISGEQNNINLATKKATETLAS